MLEARFLRWYNLERYDLLVKKQRYDNSIFGIKISLEQILSLLLKIVSCFSGKGLFARCEIPKDTPLGFYPGDRIDAAELEQRSSSRMEADRYVFTINSNELFVSHLTMIHPVNSK